MKPNINTSYRAHGKWGDFLAAIVPTIWCLNILINSNFLLRMLEWQNESSLFTIRIRGRQWYWVYKIDLKTVSDLYNTPKNIGKNNWALAHVNKIITSKNYAHLLHLRSSNSWNQTFLLDLLKKINKNNSKKITLDTDELFQKKIIFSAKKKRTIIFTQLDFKNAVTNTYVTYLNFKPKSFEKNFNFFKNLFFSTNVLTLKNKTFKELFYFLNNSGSLNTEDLILKNRFFKKFNINNDFLTTAELTASDTYKKNDAALNNTVHALVTAEKESINNYATLKQKRYTRKKNILPDAQIVNNNDGTTLKIFNRPFLIKNNLILNDNFDLTVFYKLLKKNKIKNEVSSLILSKRLLRTRKTLTLPAHVNVTAITNSYDVIHSWFIPGLGLKLDCVPGRATHHTFYIDGVGFFYGQCAEICGRYHHHMPIRLCILPFEHFLIWWNTFGLTKFFNLNDTAFNKDEFLNKKFIW